MTTAEGCGKSCGIF